MTRLVAALGAAFAAAAVASPSAAAPAATINGGGTGSWDPAGTTAASQFGLGVTVGSDGVHGRFNCIMAGRSAFPGFQSMAARGDVTAATVDPTLTVAAFSGVGTVYLNFDGPGATEKVAARFAVEVQEGGPGVGKLHLTVVTTAGSSLGPAATVVSFPPEWVSSGQIAIH
jgi:hypothetical protein